MKALTKTTRSANKAEVEKKWVLIDVDGLVVGRAAAEVAKILRPGTQRFLPGVCSLAKPKMPFPERRRVVATPLEHVRDGRLLRVHQ